MSHDGGTSERKKHVSFAGAETEQPQSYKHKLKAQKDIENTIDNHHILCKRVESKIQLTFKKLEWKEKYEKNQIKNIAVCDETCIQPYGLFYFLFFVLFCTFFFCEKQSLRFPVKR